MFSAAVQCASRPSREIGGSSLSRIFSSASDRVGAEGQTRSKHGKLLLLLRISWGSVSKWTAALLASQKRLGILQSRSLAAYEVS